MSVSYNATAKRIVISYLDNDDSNYGKAIVGTVSADNTISLELLLNLMEIQHLIILLLLLL